MTQSNERSPQTGGVPDQVWQHLSRVTGDEKHDRSAHSTLDVLWVLYDSVLDVAPERADDPRRDRFLLSKGHGPASYYAVLAAKGFLDPSALDGLASATSILGHHPDRTLVPGVEIGSGSLGHGLGLGVGVALGLRAHRAAGSADQGTSGGPRVVVLVGDAELDEGSNHEAIAVAARLGLGALTCVVIDNSSSTHGWPGGVAARFAVEGWRTTDVDGRDHAALVQALRRPVGAGGSGHRGGPDVVVAHVHDGDDGTGGTSGTSGDRDHAGIGVGRDGGSGAGSATVGTGAGSATGATCATVSDGSHGGAA